MVARRDRRAGGESGRPLVPPLVDHQCVIDIDPNTVVSFGGERDGPGRKLLGPDPPDREVVRIDTGDVRCTVPPVMADGILAPPARGTREGDSGEIRSRPLGGRTGRWGRHRWCVTELSDGASSVLVVLHDNRVLTGSHRGVRGVGGRSLVLPPGYDSGAVQEYPDSVVGGRGEAVLTRIQIERPAPPDRIAGPAEATDPGARLPPVKTDVAVTTRTRCRPGQRHVGEVVGGPLCVRAGDRLRRAWVDDG